MRTKLRIKVVATTVVAILVGGLLAWFATAGPAVAFFSGGLFLDVQVKSPATLLAKGTAVLVPVEITCNARTGTAFVDVTVTQKSGSGVAQGIGSTDVGCAGSAEQITVLVRAIGLKAFRKGDANATAEISGCNNVTCGSETDSEVIKIITTTSTTSSSTTNTTPSTTSTTSTTTPPSTFSAGLSSGG